MTFGGTTCARTWGASRRSSSRTSMIISAKQTLPMGRALHVGHSEQLPKLHSTPPGRVKAGHRRLARISHLRSGSTVEGRRQAAGEPCPSKGKAMFSAGSVDLFSVPDHEMILGRQEAARCSVPFPKGAKSPMLLPRALHHRTRLVVITDHEYSRLLLVTRSHSHESTISLDNNPFVHLPRCVENKVREPQNHGTSCITNCRPDRDSQAPPRWSSASLQEALLPPPQSEIWSVRWQRRRRSRSVCLMPRSLGN